ncbi:unnamed protein product [Cylicostephanus goldi]|uniref:Uncharacterized protein n=1 Tax=Cylicostephanus goldi TaxID=71465 RepID=A0A3P6QXP8_CYLGO|nr:unnamed protein product [Cylicostephanus goldi]
MYTVTTYGRPCSRPDKFIVLSDRILPNEYVPRIKKEVVEICSKARNYRFDSSKWNELEKASRELKGSSAEFEKLREIRQMVSSFDSRISI